MSPIGPQHGPQKLTPNLPHSLCSRWFRPIFPKCAPHFSIGPYCGDVLEVAISAHRLRNKDSTMNDINDPTKQALREFGLATSNLLVQWLHALPAEHMVAIGELLDNGAQLGVRFLSATTTKQPALVILLADQAGECHVVAETMFEEGTLQ